MYRSPHEGWKPSRDCCYPRRRRYELPKNDWRPFVFMMILVFLCLSVVIWQQESVVGTNKSKPRGYGGLGDGPAYVCRTPCIRVVS